MNFLNEFSKKLYQKNIFKRIYLEEFIQKNLLKNNI